MTRGAEPRTGDPGALGFQEEVEGVGHSQVLVLGDPAETMVL